MITDEHSEFLNNLKASLFSTLDQLQIAKHCILLDVPRHLNAGDHLIAAGTYSWLDESGRQLVHCCDKQQYNSQSVSASLERYPDATILIHGGGNLGGLWAAHDRFRKLVLGDFPKQKIVLLPQTIFFSSKESRAEISSTYATHEQLTVLCRDEVSLELAADTLSSANRKLVPDMAIALGSSLLSHSGSKQALALLRTDHEKTTQSVSALRDAGLEVSDWSSFSEPPFDKLMRRVGKLFTKPAAIAQQSRQYSQRLVRSAVEQYSGRSAVITDRLHGHLLAMLMGIPHVLFDNSYHKNRAFFDTWTKDYPGAHFVADGNVAEALRLLSLR